MLTEVPANRDPALNMLIITQLDIEKMFNTVEEHHARGYARRGCRVTFLYKKLNQQGSLLRLIKDSSLFRLHRRPDPELDSFRFNPLFNYFSGYRANAEARQAGSGSSMPLSLRLIRLLSPLSSLRDLFFVPSAVVAAVLTRRGPWQVCVGFGPWGGLTARILQRLGKVRFVVYQDRDYEPGLVPYRLRARYTAAVERFCIRRADLVCSIGFLLAERRRRESEREVHVVPNGVDWARFAAARDIPAIGQTLVYVGNVIDWAGLEYAIQALPRIRDTFPAARLRIVGDGLPAYVAGLKILVTSLGLDDCVEFMGQRRPDELPALLGGGSIGLANSEPVPFRKYACPLKIMEYMAAGLPVIATRGTEAEAMLDRYGCGLSIDYAPAPLAEAVLRLLSEPGLLRSMRSNGIRASESLTWEKLVSQELDLVHAVSRTEQKVTA
ncbi:MAG: glycosyltransferase [Gammaproteobacteria bacterium]|nr:glycosyltransferase [Gammaproteobacteria bacterium]